jgi:hypothetical protein
MRNCEMRARAGSEDGAMGVGYGRSNCCLLDPKRPVGTYVRKR